MDKFQIGGLVFAALIGGGLIWSAADPLAPEAEHPQIAACKVALAEQLRSPSSVQYVKVERLWGAEGDPVYIDYDADNAFGTQVRGEIRCVFGNPEDSIELTEVTVDGRELGEGRLLFANMAVQQAEFDRRHSDR